MLRIFIGWDSRFPEPADVLSYSLLKYASVPLQIRYLKLDELQLKRAHDPLASTEFTYTRFLPPHLCDYQGTALFLDFVRDVLVVQHRMAVRKSIHEVSRLACGLFLLFQVAAPTQATFSSPHPSCARRASSCTRSRAVAT